MYRCVLLRDAQHSRVGCHSSTCYTAHERAVNYSFETFETTLDSDCHTRMEMWLRWLGGGQGRGRGKGAITTNLHCNTQGMRRLTASDRRHWIAGEQQPPCRCDASRRSASNATATPHHRPTLRRGGTGQHGVPADMKDPRQRP